MLRDPAWKPFGCPSPNILVRSIRSAGQLERCVKAYRPTGVSSGLTSIYRYRISSQMVALGGSLVPVEAPAGVQ